MSDASREEEEEEERGSRVRRDTPPRQHVQVTLADQRKVRPAAILLDLRPQSEQAATGNGGQWIDADITDLHWKSHTD